MGMRWAGFRKVRRQVCRRVSRRMGELGIKDIPAYRVRLESAPEEWPILDSLCRIPISRFYRDRGVFDALGNDILPALAERATSRKENIRAWSAGCASGEEPYTINIVWKLLVAPHLENPPAFHIVATDADGALLGRARDGLYSISSLKDMPAALIQEAFDREGDLFRIKEHFKDGVKFVNQDIRREMPQGPFNLILCRNLAFTYFDEALQREALEGMLRRLAPGGFFVTGIHENLPKGPEKISGLLPHGAKRGIHRKAAS